MPKIADLYTGNSFSDTQKNHILKRVHNAFKKEQDALSLVKESLGELSWHYSTGGISSGRSLRAVILDEAIFCLNSNCIAEAKELLATLLALYHSPEYINEKSWFDFKITIMELPLQERVWLLTVSQALGITHMPEIASCTDAHILSLVEVSKNKRREQRMNNKG